MLLKTSIQKGPVFDFFFCSNSIDVLFFPVRNSYSYNTLWNETLLGQSLGINTEFKQIMEGENEKKKKPEREIDIDLEQNNGKSEIILLQR